MFQNNYFLVFNSCLSYLIYDHYSRAWFWIPAFRLLFSSFSSICVIFLILKLFARELGYNVLRGFKIWYPSTDFHITIWIYLKLTNYSYISWASSKYGKETPYNWISYFQISQRNNKFLLNIYKNNSWVSNKFISWYENGYSDIKS